MMTVLVNKAKIFSTSRVSWKEEHTSTSGESEMKSEFFDSTIDE